MHLRNTFGKIALGIGAVALPLTLAACGGGVSQSGSSSDNASKVFKIWHYETETSAMGQAWAKAIEIFKDEHPDIEVVVEMQTFEQLQKNAKIVLTGNDVPDIMEYNKGNATAGQLAAQGLIQPLDEYAEAGSWDTLLPGSISTTAKYTDEGLMGGDTWYGVPNYGEFVGLYYNKTMFEENGIAVPTTRIELDEALQSFTDLGITPLATAGSEYPFGQLWYELVLSNGSRQFVDNYQLFAADVDFETDPTLSGTTTAQEWVQKGYIDSDVAGLTAEDMGVSFISGKYPMMYSGSWWFGRLTEEMKDDWEIIPFPGSNLHPGSSGNLWVVPTNSSNTDLAVDFINITLRPEVQEVLAQTGGLPAVTGEYQIDDEKVAAMTDVFQSIIDEDGLAFYPDWPVAGFYDVLVAATQGLINGSLTPTEMLQQVSEAYYEGKEDLLNG